jgi:PAS domain S-box-containing protein
VTDVSPPPGPAARELRQAAARRRAEQERERQQLLETLTQYVERERASTERLVAQTVLLELAPDPIFVRDAQRRITYWNEAAERTYGYPRDEALGRRPIDLLKTVYPIPLAEIEHQVTELGSWEGDLYQTTKDGRVLTVEGRWAALYGPHGELAGLLELNRDITERLAMQARESARRAEEERERMSQRLVRAQRLESLGQLAGGVAHDFNNVLAVIVGYAGSLSKRLERLTDTADPVDPVELSGMRTQAEQIGDAAQRAARLTHQLLAFARQDTVQVALLDVNETISGMLHLLERTLGPHIELVTALGPGLGHVHIDSGQLAQLLVNLAVNSREAMPDGGQLTVRTEETRFEEERTLTHGEVPAGPYVRIAVHDTGTGMTRDVVEHAFDPFFTTRPVGEGTGLGLATVYGIATRAGGQAEIYSEPGEGTTITILLPSHEAAGEPASAAAPGPRASRAATILVVDDEPALLRLTATNLRDAGYDVIAAGGGEAALEAAAQPGREIDLVLTDVMMPGLLGQHLAQRLDELLPGIPLVYMSGFPKPSPAADGRQLDGALLLKPFSEDDLLRTVAHALDDRPGNRTND